MNKKTLIIMSVFLIVAVSTAVAAESQAFITGLHNPVWMLYDLDGRLYITDLGTQTVSRYDAEGRQTVITNDNDVEDRLLKDTSIAVMAASVRHAHLKPESTIRELLEHPAFSGFAHNLLTRDSDLRQTDLRLDQVSRLMPYHRNVDTGTVVNALNAMIDSAGAGNTIFYDFYNEHQKCDDPSKNATGLFFFRGKSGAPFAVICPGGGFSYVGSFQEGFPYAMKLSQKGYNVFVLKYRVGGGGMPATQDLAVALSFLFSNAENLKISCAGYSLWGSSAGARMVAYIGSHGAARFGGKQIPAPSAIVMAYTGHSEFTPNDPPTFTIVSADDPIVRVSNVENRIAGMRDAGIVVEYRKYRSAGHGFGLGLGTDAEGWMEHAIRFWKKHLPFANEAFSGTNVYTPDDIPGNDILTDHARSMGSS